MLKFFVTLLFTLKHNYFDGLTKLFSDLYLAKFLDALAKLFFSCKKPLKQLTLIRYMR